MDLGREPERDSVGPVMCRSHAEEAAGCLIILAVGLVLPVQEQTDLIDGLTDADQCLIAVIEEKRRGLDLVRRRSLEDGFQFGWQLAGDLADSQAVDFQGSAGLGGDRLFIGRFPDRLVDRRVAKGAIHDRHAEHAFSGLDDLPALAADSPEQGLGPKLIPVRIAARQAEQSADQSEWPPPSRSLPTTRRIEFMGRNPFRVISKKVHFEKRKSLGFSNDEQTLIADLSHQTSPLAESPGRRV